MRAMRMLRLIVHARTREPVLLLGEIDGERCLPVFLRPAQAEVIAFGPRGEGDPPLTQDLIGPVVRGLGRSLDRVEITELRDGLFSADLVFDQGTRIAARPSDALAVAVRDGLPIGVDDEILDEVGQPVAELFPHGGDAPPAEQLREFRQFIDEVSPEDFGDASG
ncbi:bifunctional nuclease family protein [Pseudonocardia sp. H11422]|uniref:bifunctional nuclease family protein n=1 Tax=Pseudonocardia sp. H11422 TaxID=2835866 RepID=UPI001BDC8A40|nr:bifunctional nuclease family protein [Pseudonocardia sp. H11422]